MDGFTDTLLLTDRWPWSDVTGLNSQPLHSFQLPSRSWEWEGDWYVDQSCGGEPSQTGVRTSTYPHEHTHTHTAFFSFLFACLFSSLSVDEYVNMHVKDTHFFILHINSFSYLN